MGVVPRRSARAKALTLRHARACISAGCDVVALDATGRPRPDGRTFEQTVEALQGETLIMADCACIDDVRRALDAGCDIDLPAFAQLGSALDDPSNDNAPAPSAA